VQGQVLYKVSGIYINLEPCTKTKVYMYTIHKLHPLATHFW